MKLSGLDDDMKRDLDLVRCILISVEKADGPIGDAMLAKCCEDISRLAFHIELMQAHGLLTASVKRDAYGDPLSLEVGGLTWEGYDYLDAIRSPQVWNKAKDAISKAVGDTSLSIVKQTCTTVATGLIMSKLGM